MPAVEHLIRHWLMFKPLKKQKRKTTPPPLKPISQRYRNNDELDLRIKNEINLYGSIDTTYIGPLI